MGSFYNDASLVMIPSGYKDQKVYCAKPADGSGDLVFSRASSATRVQSDGLIEKVRTNSLLNSQNFSAWTLMGAAIRTLGTVDPNGGTTAATISNIPAGNLTDGIRLLSNPVSASTGTPIRFSIYLKGSGTIRIAIERSVSGDYFYYSVLVTLTSTWTRYEVGGNTGNSNGAGVYVYNATGSTATSVDVAFGQIELGDVITDYIPTTTAAVSVGPVSGLPRLDYLNSTCPKLLLEPQRTNLVVFSEQINNAGWSSNNLTITANQAISPDGTQNADLLDDGTASITQHWIYQFTSFASSTAYTISFYAKYISRKYMTVNLFNGSTSQYVDFNIENGTILGSTGDVTASITSVGNGWYRIVYTRTTAASGSPNFRIGLADDTGSESYTGSNKQTFIYGCQIEAGAYATSYIPTLGASVTRVADAASKTGITSLIGQSEGVVFVEFNNRLLASYPNEYIVQIISGTTQLWLRKELAGNSFTARLIVSGTTIWTFASLIVPINGNNKIAIAYKTGDSAVFLNGAQVSSTNTAAFSGSAFADLNFNFGGTLNPELPLSQALLFTTRLTNAQLAELTAL
jgi:hypothetical protein